VRMPLLRTESSGSVHGQNQKKNQLHAATRDKRLTLPACDEVWFDDRALGAFSLRTVIHWVGGASGTSRRLRMVVVEERNVLFASFRNSGDQTIYLPGMAPGSDGLSPEFSESDELSQISVEMTNFHCFPSNSRTFSFLSEVTK
jgi:hypothetical protein